MKFAPKVLLFLVLFLLFQVITFAQNGEILKKEKELEDKISRIDQELKRLETKLVSAGTASKEAEIKYLIEGQKVRKEKLEEVLKEIVISKAALSAEAQRLYRSEFGQVPVEESEEEGVVQSEPEAEIRVYPEAMRGLKVEIGGIAGLFCATTTIGGELRAPLPYVLGPASSFVRLALSLSQSKDASRRYLPLQMDALLKVPPGVFTGVENYIGAGLNYVVLTTGRTAGAGGWEIFYGVESEGFKGKVFGEIGFGVLRTGFSPNHQGVTLLVGYRRQFTL